MEDRFSRCADNLRARTQNGSRYICVSHPRWHAGVGLLVFAESTTSQSEVRMGFIWFWLVAVMIVAYVIFDGFDIGVGILHPFLARSEQDRQIMIRSIGPVWDGNEVWLLAGGGTLYFAFPLLYASAFSGFYLALMVVLWLLIMRGCAIELRMQVPMGVWRTFFDAMLCFSSALLAIFFGAALANVIRGVPLGADGYFFLPLWTNWL